MKIKNNLLSVKLFLLLLVAGSLLLAVIYGLFFTPFSLSILDWLCLIASVAFFTSLTLYLSLRWERNLPSLITGLLLPILFFESVRFTKYCSVVRSGLIFGIMAVIFIAVFYTKLTLIIPVRMDRAKQRKVFLVKTAATGRILLGLLLLNLCLQGRVQLGNQYIVKTADIINGLSAKQEIAYCENTLTANLEELSRLDPQGGWVFLSTDQKLMLLKKVIQVECQSLGMEDTPDLQLAFPSENEAGSYNPIKDVITISQVYFTDEETNGYNILRVVLHEVYHRYSYRCVDLLKMIRENGDTSHFAKLRLWEPFEMYEKEFENYNSGESDFEAYYYQACEHDARNYASAGLVAYASQIQAYLKSKPTD